MFPVGTGMNRIKAKDGLRLFNVPRRHGDEPLVNLKRC